MAERTLYQWFAGSVRRFPEEPALQLGERQLTYRELHSAAEAVAGAIVTAHGGVPRRVALLASRSLTAFAGYLAALRLGAVVTPVNPDHPAARNRDVVRLAGAEVLLTDGPTVPAELAGVAGTELSLPSGPGAGPAPRLPPYAAGPDDVAYVLFTSGSTGRPKGVPITHRNLHPYLAHNIERYRVRPGSRVSHTFDLTFDPSVFDLFVTWGGGGTLVVPQRAELLEPVDYIAHHDITHWFSVPSVVSVTASLGNLPTGKISSLRYSIFIGEQLTFTQARAWRAIAPDAVIENVYGPTELTVACTEYALPADVDRWPVTSNGTVPIGPVYGHLESVVLDEAGHPATEGELCVRGNQRFGGYLDESDNAGRFVGPDGQLTPRHYYRTGDRVRLEGGNWVHLGRLDHQVKIRGYRIELGEIEVALRRHPGVRDVVVSVLRYDEDNALFASYTGDPVPAAQLRRWLRRRLPIHMVPRRFVHLTELPLNPNGKVDRRRLQDLHAAGSVSS
jgi:amino acid adenylation domain-containing protein